MSASVLFFFHLSVSWASSPYPTMRPLPYCREAGEFSFTTCKFDSKHSQGLWKYCSCLKLHCSPVLPQGSLCRSSEHRVPHFFLVAPSFSCLSLPRTSTPSPPPSPPWQTGRQPLQTLSPSLAAASCLLRSPDISILKQLSLSLFIFCSHHLCDLFDNFSNRRSVLHCYFQSFSRFTLAAIPWVGGFKRKRCQQNLRAFPQRSPLSFLPSALSS